MSAYPDFTPVVSSNISGVAFDTKDKSLYIKFKTGSIYKYSDVEFCEDLHDDLIDAASPGSFFHSSIRDVYPGSQIG
jgi:KTSC domain